MTKPKPYRAPPPGSYVGTVDDHNAVFVVTDKVVEAIWFRPRRAAYGGFDQRGDAWDVEGGKFRPTYSGEPVAVKVNTRSRRFAHEDANA